jgi:hypothetical protein
LSWRTEVHKGHEVFLILSVPGVLCGLSLLITNIVGDRSIFPVPPFPKATAQAGFIELDQDVSWYTASSANSAATTSGPLVSEAIQT